MFARVCDSNCYVCLLDCMFVRRFIRLLACVLVCSFVRSSRPRGCLFACLFVCVFVRSFDKLYSCLACLVVSIVWLSVSGFAR